MKSDVERNVDHLMDEIGEIDDKYPTEAADRLNAPRRTSGNRFLRTLLIAATLSVIMALLVGMFSLARLLPGHGPVEGTTNKTPSVQNPTTLAALLANCTQSDNLTPTTAGDLDFFDGTVRLAVENRASGELFLSRPLTVAEQNVLTKEFSSAGRRVTAEIADDFLVWVIYGDGRVVTPCLAPVAGNVGAATLFDYDSEREPTQFFLDLLSDLS